MADKEKKVSENSKAEKTAADEVKAAEKVAKAAKAAGNKSDKPNIFVRAGRGIKHFYKDLKGEVKKIVWPDAQTVLKSTGVVIVVVTLVTAVIFAIDQGLAAGIGGLKKLALGEEETTVSQDADQDKKDDEKSGDKTDEKETTEKRRLRKQLPQRRNNFSKLGGVTIVR